MRRVKHIPRTDLNKLSEEVLARGCAAALPRNLPDRWLRALGRDIVKAHKAEAEGRGDDAADSLLGPLLVVTTLVANKQKVSVDEAALSASEIMEALQKFGRALEEEIVGRETGVFVHQYTTENIV